MPPVPPLVATAAPAEGVILTATQVVKSHKAVNLSLLKLGPLVATILGGVFTVITIVSAAAIVVVVVVASNPLAPVPSDDFAASYKQMDVPIYVLSNDKDPRGNTLKILSVSTPKNGQARIVPPLGTSPGYIMYKSNQFFSGNDTFTYTIQNEQQKTADAKVTVTVMNRPPTAVDIVYDGVRKNVPYTADIFAYVTFDGRKINDVDNDTLTIVQMTSPSNGQIQVNGRFITYTPVNNYRGTDQVTYTISDVDNALASGNITFTVQNQAPIAKMDQFTFRKNTQNTLDVLANDIDLNGDNITITAVFGSAYGVASIIEDGKYINFLAGPKRYDDSFQYTITDGQDFSTSFGLVNFYNMPPSVSAPAISVSKNSVANSVSVTFSDPDDLDAVTLSTDVSGTTGAVESVATETIVEKNYFNQLFMRVSTYSYNVTYTPKTGFLGTDSFKFVVDDNEFKENSIATATVSVTVTNDAPVAVDDAVQCRKNINCEFEVISNDSDPNGDSVRLPESGAFETTTSANGGSLTRLSNGQIRYRAAQDFIGTDTFKYRVVDIQDAGFESFAKQSAFATVTVTVVNDVPVAADVNSTVLKTQSVEVNVLDVCTDANGDALVVSDVSTSVSGVTPVIFLKNGKTWIRYTALDNKYVDTFTYRVRDNSNDFSNYATVQITVTNRAPVANNDQYTATWNNADRSVAIDLNVLDNDTDADSGDKAKLRISSIVGAPSGVSNRGTHLTYEPAQGFVGTVTFTYYATDSLDESNAGTVSVSVNNNAPVAGTVSTSTHFKVSTTVDVLAACSDSNNDRISLVRLVSNPSAGSALIENVNGKDLISFTPATNPYAKGQVSFTYEVTDGNLQSIGTVRINVTNSVPQAAADSYSVHWRQASSLTFNVMVNDNDANTNDLPLNLNSAVTLGTGFVAGAANADIANRVITYSVPASSAYTQGWNRINTFTYSVNDGLDSSSAVVTVTHTNANQPSTLTRTANIHWTVQKAGISLPALTSTSDADGDSLTLRSASGPAASYVTVNSQQGTVTYARSTPAKVTDTFAVVYDDGLDSSVINYSVSVYNNQPVARNIAATIPFAKRATGIQIDLTPTDVDPEDASNLSVVGPIAAGTQGSGSVRSLNGNVLTYSFPAGFTGSDILTYTVTDSFETSAVAIINITMTTPDQSAVDYTYQWTQALAGVTLDLFADVETQLPNDAAIDSISTPASKGTAAPINGQNGKVTYTWLKSVSNLGADSFVVYWTSSTTSQSGYISVSVTITNQKPVCNINAISGHWRTYFDNTQSIDATSTVVVENGEVRTAQSIVTHPTLGTSNLSGNSVTYKMTNPGLNSDSITVRISDGLETCDVQIRLSFTNTAPSAPAQSLSPHWRSAMSGYSFDASTGVSDANTDPFTILSVVGTAPTFGSVAAVSGSTYRFTANLATLKSNLRKPSTFTYTVSDRVSTSTGSLTITPVNSAPVANNDGSANNRISVSASSRISNGQLINVYANDVENDSVDLPFISISLPSATSTGGATLSVEGTSVRYIPPSNTGASFQDSFTYTLSDGIETSTATVFIVVVNSPPVAVARTETMKWNLNPGRTIDLTALCTDSDGDAISLTYSQPSSKKGDITTTATPGIIVYTPKGSSIVEADYVNNVAADSISFTCTDIAGNSASNTVSIRIQNSAPTGNDIVVSRPKLASSLGTSFTINLITNAAMNDADGDTISFVSQNYVSANAVRRGTVSVSGTILTYTINTVSSGTENWQFVMTDGNRQVTKQITVTFTNAPPTCSAASLGSQLRSGFTITDMLTRVAANDANGDTINISAVSLNTANAGTVTRNSNTNIAFVGSKYNGAVSATVTLSDGESTTSCAVSFTYSNRVPTGNALTKQYLRVAGTPPNYVYSVISEARIIDADGDSVEITGATGNGCGNSAVGFTSSTVTFTPQANAQFSESSPCVITYTFSDDASPVASSSLTISISIIDAAPIAIDDYFTFKQGETTYTLNFADILANDTDANGDALTISTSNIVGCSAPTCTTTANTISVTFDPNLCNTFKFQYRATGNAVDSNLATVSIKPTNCKCSQPVDIVFVLDGSGSISDTNWGNMKTFINGIVDQLTLSSSLVRVATVQYSETASFVSPYGYQYQTSRSSAKTATNNLSQYASWTATRQGLKKGYNYLTSQRRTNVPAVIVLITDGDSNRPCVGSNGEQNRQCQDVIDYESGADYGFYCQSRPSNTGCTNSHAIATYPTYANRVRTCDACNFNTNRCFPCADPVFYANNVVKAGGVKIVALGVGDAISASGKDAIAQVSSSGVYRSAPWNDLASAVSMIVDTSCDTTA